MNTPPTPLDPITSIKVKLGALVAATVTVAALLATLGAEGGVPALLSVPVAVVLALGVTQLLAVGMTSPLRQMTAAAREMARGDYTRRITTTSRDEVGELAQTFNRMAEELAAVDRERRALIANVSHELRTPLAALGARLENLADGVEPADPAALRSLLDQAGTLGTLVADLLDLSRLDAGVITLQPEEVDVAAFLRRLVAEAAVPGRDTTYVVEVPEGLSVVADPGRLRQLVANLLDNAARHGPPGGRVLVRAVAGEGSWRLEVSDAGPGIAPADRDRVFERFGTLAGHEGGGTGLGLAIARWVAELHGGTVRFVDPDPAVGGALARVDLPADGRRATTVPEDSMDTTPSAPDVLLAPAGPAAPPVPSAVTSVFGDFWPDRGVPPRRDLLLACAGVGVLAAVVLPFRDPGLAVLMVLLASIAVVVRAARHRRDPFTLACAAAATALSLPVVLLDAVWITTLCWLAGGAVLLVGVTRGRSGPGFVLAGLAWPLASLRGLPWFARTLRGAADRGSLPALVRTGVFSLVALLVFGLLFASADALVATWLGALLPDWTIDAFVFRAFVGAAVFALLLAAAYLALNPPTVEVVDRRAPTPVGARYEWLTPVLLVDAMFLVFLAAQATVVFGGHDYLRRTTGLTYADYVHQGFGQLTVATALTLVVVWAAARKAPRATPADRTALRASLGVLCLLTLVVVASALSRMHLYQEAYGFTRLRLLVDVFEGWLGLVVLAVLVAGLRLRGAWLPRAAVLGGAIGLLGLALVNPDAWIARHNVERYETTGKVDWQYLATLSADAVPAVRTLPGDLQACILSYSAGGSFGDDALAWNLGRARARDAFGGTVPEFAAPVRCPGDLGSR